MPRPLPHPLALFSLAPLNKSAEDVVAHVANSHLVSTLSDGTLGLDIGFHIRSKSCDTLATLGRNDNDITMEGSSLGRVQCSFEIDLATGIFMVYDRSNGQTTQLSGQDAMPFEYGRLRRVVVHRMVNIILGMGGVKCNLVQFKLRWHRDPVQVIKMMRNQEALFYSGEENPRLTRTVDASPTDHAAGLLKLKIR